MATKEGRVEAKKALENYAYDMRNTVRDEKSANKLDAGDKQSIEKAVQEAIEWVDKNQQLAEVDQIEDKLKELKGICNPIVSKMYQQGGGGGGVPMDDNMDDGAVGGSGGTIEEVD